MTPRCFKFLSRDMIVVRKSATKNIIHLIDFLCIVMVSFNCIFCGIVLRTLWHAGEMHFEHLCGIITYGLDMLINVT